MAEAPPAPQPVQQLPNEPAPTLQEGCVQGCQGYLKRRTKILKRWKKQWFSIAPGKQAGGVAGLEWNIMEVYLLVHTLCCLNLRGNFKAFREEKCAASASLYTGMAVWVTV